MKRPQHNRAFSVTVVWTLVLLFLGSVVHATGSSLACPDWPTCFGTMVPEMSGGVFWEHLHRLVAGGLILMFGLATYLAWREVEGRPWILKACWAGIALLLVQAVLGGVTVILELPDAISTSHLLLAFLFLALATVLSVTTSPRWGRDERPDRAVAGLRPLAVGAAVLVTLQSVLGGWVRHAEAGMACPDVPLCLGEWVPPLESHFVALHFSHRVLGLVVGIVVVLLSYRVLRRTEAGHLQKAAALAAGLALGQILVGFLSVSMTLAVAPVSIHTLLAASLLAVLTAMATYTWEPAAVEGAVQAAPEAGAGGAAGAGTARAEGAGAGGEAGVAGEPPRTGSPTVEGDGS